MNRFSKLWIVALALLAPLPIAADDDSLLVVAPADRTPYWEVKKLEEPYYPAEAAAIGVEGCASVAFIIERNGATSNWKPLVSVPEDIFTLNSMRAIRQWKFKPGQANAKKEAVYTFQTIVYALPGSEDSGNEERPSSGDQCEAAAMEAFRALTG